MVAVLWPGCGVVVRAVAVSAALATWLAGATTAPASGWSIQQTPIVTGETEVVLNGVSCPSPTVCTAVGYTSASAGSYVPLVERWTRNS